MIHLHRLFGLYFSGKAPANGKRQLSVYAKGLNELGGSALTLHCDDLAHHVESAGYAAPVAGTRLLVRNWVRGRRYPRFLENARLAS